MNTATYALFSYLTVGLALFLFLLAHREWRWLNMGHWFDWVLAPLYFMAGWPVFCVWLVAWILVDGED